MTRWLVRDELWGVIELVILEYPPSPKGGQVCLIGILFVSKTGILRGPRTLPPHKMEFCSMTLWSRLRDWIGGASCPNHREPARSLALSVSRDVDGPLAPRAPVF